MVIITLTRALILTRSGPGGGGGEVGRGCPRGGGLGTLSPGGGGGGNNKIE